MESKSASQAKTNEAALDLTVYQPTFSLENRSNLLGRSELKELTSSGNIGVIVKSNAPHLVDSLSALGYQRLGNVFWKDLGSPSAAPDLIEAERKILTGLSIETIEAGVDPWLVLYHPRRGAKNLGCFNNGQ